MYSLTIFEKLTKKLNGKLKFPQNREEMISFTRNVVRTANKCGLHQQRLSSSNTKEQPKEWTRKVISGIQPTGILHIGNYFGAIRRWVQLQNDGEDVSYFIADLHCMTMPYKAEELRENIFELTATLLACGIDEKKSTIFLQSQIPQHTELQWIFSCLSTNPRLMQLPQYKEKSAQVKNCSTGLFMYPILQAADILVHKATHVPCGEDQLQQLQLAMHLANKFNSTFGETFPIIEPLIGQDASGRIRSLRDPTKKQSKSDPNGKSRITLRDKPDEIRQKIKRAITDFTSAVTYDPENRPGVSNLIGIHALVKNVSPEQICEQVKGKDTGQYKPILAEDLVNLLDPIRLKIEDYLNNRDYLLAVLKDGRTRAAETAEKTMSEVKQKIGVLQ